MKRRFVIIVRKKTLNFLNRKILVISFFALLIISIFFQPASADERIWVHVSYLDEYINSLCFIGGAVPITTHFRLYDDDGYYLEIQPFSCIDEGALSIGCSSGGTWRLSSAWDIDNITRTAPTAKERLQEVCFTNSYYMKDCVPAWYPVDIPDGFDPISYRYGCSSNYDIFRMPHPNDNHSDSDNDGFTKDEGDCNDQDYTVFPEADETCDDGIDQDCDGYDLSCDSHLIQNSNETTMTDSGIDDNGSSGSCFIGNIC